MANSVCDERRVIGEVEKRTATVLYGVRVGEKGEEWGLAREYLPLVKSIVGRMRIYFPEGVMKEDLYSIGLGGLIGAIKSYDGDRGVAFGYYAKMKIRGALLDELRRMDLLSRGERKRYKEYQRRVGELEQKLGREAKGSEIREYLGISEEEMVEYKGMVAPVFLPLDYKGVGGEGLELGEVMEDPTEMDPGERLDQKEVVEALRTCINKLKDIERKVLGLYYLEGLRLAEIGQVMRLTESRVCQIHAKAVSQLRIELKRYLNQ